MCNLYSITKGQTAIIALTRAMRDTTGNLPPMSGVFGFVPGCPQRCETVLQNVAMSAKGTANAPYKFSGKASIVTTKRRAPAGQLVLHAVALPGNRYDGHTPRDVIAATQNLTGCSIERAYVDKGYRGHDTEKPHRVFRSGQKRGVFSPG